MTVPNGFPQRLLRTLRQRNLTQSRLAALVGGSQTIVSLWCQGRLAPAPDKLHALARALDVSADWLCLGAAASDSAPLWCFRPAPADGGRDYGNANIWSFDPGIKDLVREALQNALDARLPDGGPVRVVFRIIRLTGDDLRAYQCALGWSRLRLHLEAATDNLQKLGLLLRDGLRELTERGELLLLVIDDAGTTGLLGPEKEPGKFTALCRNNLDSNKEGAGTKGGAFGLGKGVLWRASRLSTVLFCSTLARPDEAGRSQLRILGRCELPWHECSDRQFAGPGWFGQANPAAPDDAVSCWENEALARDLYLSRRDSGTSACVVGFHDMSSGLERSPVELAVEVVHAAAGHFFPALAARALEVAVEVYEDRRQYLEGSPGFRQLVNVEQLQPGYCAMLRAYRSGNVTEALGAPGSVAVVPVTLHVSRRTVEPTHGELEHEAVLLVQAVGESESNERVNELVMFRGPGMVVEAVNLTGVCLGVRPFRALLLCGLAPQRASEAPRRSPTVDSAAEEFLRTAEPPAHCKWIGTAELGAAYARGCKTRLEDFLRAAKERVRELVRQTARDLGDGPHALRELFRIGDEPGLPPDRPWVTHLVGTVRDGQWHVEARIRLKPRQSRLRLSPVVCFQAETGGGQAVAWASLESVKNCSVDGTDLIIEPDTRELRFRGQTNVGTHPVPAPESCIVVDVRKVAVMKGSDA